MNFFFLVAESLRRRMAALGFRKVVDLVGRVEHLRQRRDVTHWKAKRLDLSMLLAKSPRDGTVPRHCIVPQKKNIAGHLDEELIRRALPTLEGGAPSTIVLEVANTHRAVGAMLSGEIARRFGAQGLGPDAIVVNLHGSAGQSFGAFTSAGVTLQLEGDANDYVGKGLSGGRLVVFPPAASRFVAAENVIIGNTALYGATSGALYVAGMAGERFAVRNSGARAVVEGIGDHGCEYMTGGVVVVLGQTGRNFGAGMSGGAAFVFDKDRQFRQLCNPEMVELESLIDESDVFLVYGLIENHLRYTNSALARKLLDNWEHMVPRFVKVMPTEYKRVLQARRAALRPPHSSPPTLRVVGGQG